MPTTEVHPSAQELKAFALGTLTVSDSNTIERHLVDCPVCRESVDAPPDDTFVMLLRSAQSRYFSEAETPREFRLSSDTGIWQSGTPIPQPVELTDHPRYRLIRPLGTGGMGAVWLAEHKVMGRQVALKLIRPEFLAQPGAVERFRRETQASARLSHPHLVAALDAEQVEGLHFLVMEYLDGVTLAERVATSGPLPVMEACRCVREAALGLQHAHENGLVHRDLKPHNLMLVNEPGSPVKVLDFGLATLASRDPDTALTGQNMIVGTPDYIAPEQAEDSRMADIRSDVYSLGCTLYFLLSGHVPFPDKSTLRKLLGHQRNDPDPVRSLRPEVPVGLAAVLSKMMAKDPDARYQTPAEVATVLEPFIRAGGEERQRKPWILVGVAIATLLFLLGGTAVYRIQTDTGELVITTESEDVEVIVKQGGKVVRIIDTKTDGSITLRSGVYELELKDAGEGLKLNVDQATLTRGKTVLARIERVTKPRPAEKVGEMYRIPWGEADRRWNKPPAAQFSPDGKRLLVIGNVTDGSKLFDPITGKDIGDRIDTAYSMFTPDGKYIVGLQDRHLRVVDARDGSPVRDLPQLPAQLWSMRISPTQPLAFTARADGVRQLWDLETGKELHRWRDRWEPYVFTANGKHMVLGDSLDRDEPFRLWNIAEEKEGPGNGVAVRGVFESSFLKGGKEMVVCHGGKLHFHEVASGKPLRTIGLGDGLEGTQGREGIISRDGRLFVVPATDKSIRVWDLESGREIHCFAKLGHPGHVLAISPDGRLAAVGILGNVIVLRLPEPK